MDRVALIALLLLLGACVPQPPPGANGGGPPAASAEASPAPSVPSTAARPGARSEYFARVAAALEPFVRREMADKELPAVAVALLADGRVVWSGAYGLARPKDSVPARPAMLARVGSVSKPVTALAVLQLVEEGLIALDTPVARYLPELSGPAARATPRQLLAHHAGIVREPPVGSYFDPTSPELTATVLSLDSTPRIYPAGDRLKYSNAGYALLGYLVERLRGEPFERVVQRRILEPLGLADSGFAGGAADRELPRRERRAVGHMAAYDRPLWPAPIFELGIGPAAGLYSTAEDLARFLGGLFASAEGDGVIRAATLDSMLAVQFAPPGQAMGSGLGLWMSELEGRRRVGHDGWMYGFATEMAGLPEEGLGAVVVATVDGANTVTRRIADTALRLMLAHSEGAELVVPPPTSRPPEGARALEGFYGDFPTGWEIDSRGGGFLLRSLGGGAWLRLRALSGDTLIVDDRLSYGLRLLPLGEGRVVFGRDTLPRRAPIGPPPPAPAPWAERIGEFGWEHNPLYVLERDGRLHILIEWFFAYPLDEISPDTFRLPDRGYYPGEPVIFERADWGELRGARVGGVLFPRRRVSPEDWAAFRIRPERPVGQLRREALAAVPPQQPDTLRAPDLVDLASLDPTIRIDLRYGTANNFMGAAFYDRPRALLQRPAAEALVRAHRDLAAHGYGIVVFDAYRPWYVTRMFWEATPDSQRIFVADPARGSRHNRGAAADVGLFELATGREVEMVSGYDEFSPRAFAAYPGGTARQRWHRELLREAMERHGFEVLPEEWWHFDFRDWRSYPVLNLDFDEITFSLPSRPQ